MNEKRHTRTEPPDEVLLRLERILQPLAIERRDNRVTIGWWRDFRRICLHGMTASTYVDELVDQIENEIDAMGCDAENLSTNLPPEAYTSLLLLCWLADGARIREISVECGQPVGRIERLADRMRTASHRSADARLALRQLLKLRFAVAESGHAASSSPSLHTGTTGHSGLTAESDQPAARKDGTHTPVDPSRSKALIRFPERSTSKVDELFIEHFRAGERATRVTGRTIVNLVRMVVEQPDQDHSWAELARSGAQSGKWIAGAASLARAGRRFRARLPAEVRFRWEQNEHSVRWASG